jgi:hypothetical protein
MRNISRALKPGGRLMFVTWRSVEHNPWAGLPKAVVLKVLPPPGEDAQTCGPGPFSMANTDIVGAQLKAAGFEDVAFQATDGPVMILLRSNGRCSFSSRSSRHVRYSRADARHDETPARRSKRRYLPSWLAIAIAGGGCHAIELVDDHRPQGVTPRQRDEALERPAMLGITPLTRRVGNTEFQRLPYRQREST